MKEGDLPPISKLPAAGSVYAFLLAKGRYKFWALAAILLLAFWSMLTGTVTLKWSTGNLDSLADDFLSSSVPGTDLDVLEVEEGEKIVRQMWEVYVHGRRVRLLRFWQEAFEAAYEELDSDDARVRDSAVAEIARMSMRMLDLDTSPRRHRTDDGEKNHNDGGTRSKVRSPLLPSAEAQ